MTNQKQFRWHHKPKGKNSVGVKNSNCKCSICGAGARVKGVHRRVRDTEKYEREFLVRDKKGIPFEAGGKRSAKTRIAKAPPEAVLKRKVTNGKELLAAYVATHDLAPGSAVTYSCALARWGRYLGHTPKLTEFTDSKVNEWLTAELKAEQVLRCTVHSYRRPLLTIWRWGHIRKYIKAAPLDVKKVSAQLPIPRALPSTDIVRMLSAAAEVGGRFRRSKISRKLFLSAIIQAAWESGLRLGDLLRMTWEDAERGMMTQGKTGWPKFFKLSASTMAAMELIRREDEPRVFGGIVNQEHLYPWMRRLSKAAGVKCGTKMIRKSAATAVEQASPGGAMGFLGHKTVGLAIKHYIDPFIVGPNRPSPPALLASAGKVGA